MIARVPGRKRCGLCGVDLLRDGATAASRGGALGVEALLVGGNVFRTARRLRSPPTEPGVRGVRGVSGVRGVRGVRGGMSEHVHTRACTPLDGQSGWDQYRAFGKEQSAAMRERIFVI